MDNNEEIKKEDKRALKEVFEKLIDEEPKEMSQEEAIKTYQEHKSKKSSNTSTSGETTDSNQEESEHLKRIKIELLSSLKRVDELAKRIFIDKEIKAKNILKNTKTTTGMSNTLQKDLDKEHTKQIESNPQKETGKTQQMQQIIQNDEKTIE